MTDRPTFDPFERRIAAEFERYVQPAADPKPIDAIVGAAMRPRGLAVRARNLSRPRRFLLLGIAAAFLVPATYLGAGSLRHPTSDLDDQVQPLSRIQVGQPVGPRWFAADGQSLWVHEPQSLVSVDMATSAVTGQVNTGSMEYGYAATGGGSVWQTDYEGGLVLRIDPVSGKTLATIPVGLQPLGVVVTAGGVWVANEHSGSVTRIDPATDKVVATIQINSPDSFGPQLMAAGPGGGVWVGVPNMGSVVRIDAATNKVGLVVPFDGYVASDGAQVWLAVDAGIDGLPQAIRIDPDSGKVITAVDLEQGPGECGLAVGLGSVWVATGGLTRIDPATGRIVGRLDLGGDCGNLIVAGGAIWSAAEGKSYVDRISPT